MTETQRMAFSRQPAHVILVDFRPPFDKETTHNLSHTLEQFFSLVCAVSGPCRVPFFGLVALGNYPETLFLLQHVRGNYSRLQRALSDLRQFYEEGAPTDPKSVGCLPEGLQEAVGMFHKQAQSLLRTAGYWGQLEVTIFSSLNALTIVRQVDKAIKDISLDSLKKIQVVCISSPDQLTIPEDLSISSQGSGSETSGSGETAGMVDFVTMDNDLLNLENFFKGWLHDCATESEHLQLMLPLSGSNEEDALVLRCDLQERVISPSQLPFPGNFNLCLEGHSGKPVASGGARGMGLNVSVHKLRALQRITADNICESVLYGQPLVVRSTSCWRLDWDELEMNKQHFTALCSLLSDQNQALLACLEEDTPKPASRGFRYQVQAPCPKGHFLLLPSRTSTLLLKSIAVSELMLPVEIGPTLETPTEESQALVGKALEQVEEADCFNPLLVESGLYESLTYHLTKSLPPASGPGKRKMLTLKPTTQVGRKPRPEQGPSWDSSSQDASYGGGTGPSWDVTLMMSRNKRPRQNARENCSNQQRPGSFPTQL